MNKTVKIILLLASVFALILVIACAKAEENADTGKANSVVRITYHEITPDEALSMMRRLERFVVLDARDKDAYQAGHVPGAICLGQETVEKSVDQYVTDKALTDFIYGKDKETSITAADRLCKMGYSNVYVFGGIGDWPGELVFGNDPGEPVKSKMTQGLVIRIGAKSFEVAPEENVNFIDKAANDPFVLKMEDRGGVEKAAQLPFVLSANDEEQEAIPGDVLLYQGKTVAICYEATTGTFTKIGHILGPTTAELKDLLRSKETDVSFLPAGER